MVIATAIQSSAEVFVATVEDGHRPATSATTET
jgi:hypothetical protein